MIDDEMDRVRAGLEMLSAAREGIVERVLLQLAERGVLGRYERDRVRVAADLLRATPQLCGAQ